MAFQPQGFLFQPPVSVSVALPSPCPSFGPGLLLGPRAEDLARSSSGSAFAPYPGSATSSGFGAHLYGAEPRGAAAAAALGSFVGAGYEPPSGISGSVDFHPFGPLGPYAFGDPSYRKNATRDATATLKAWLGEHRKNPYPTKGEKIMLAILTKMTLTQVSTWFANARRRLKKENKMTWTPRTRSEDEEDEDNLDLERNDQGPLRTDQGPLRTDQGPEGRSRSASRHPPLAGGSCVLMFRDDSGSDSERGAAGPDPGARTLPCVPSPSPMGAPPEASAPEPAEPPSKNPIQGPNAAPKPKLWSLAEIATSADKSRGRREGEGPGPGPAHFRPSPRTLFPHSHALPRHLYYTSALVHGYSGPSSLGPLRGVATATHVNGLHQTMLQRAEAKLHSHDLQKGS